MLMTMEKDSPPHHRHHHHHLHHPPSSSTKKDRGDAGEEPTRQREKHRDKDDDRLPKHKSSSDDLRSTQLPHRQDDRRDRDRERERDRDRDRDRERDRDRDRERDRVRDRDRDHSERTHSVETVDRGVGPTPLPPPITDHRVPPYFGISPYPPDPRNGLAESHLAYPYLYPSIPFGINAPLPVNSQTNEGRYQWPPPPMAFPSPSHGIAASPTYSDMSAFSMQGRSPGSEPISNFVNRIQWEQFRRMFPSPYRGYSPAHLPGLPSSSFLPHPPGGLPSATTLSQRSIFSEHPATPGSGSVTLPGSVESSRLTSPRPSIIGKGGRKRALSHSPFSECGYLDIESLTRSSEGSLHLTPFQPNSRSSSAASGSYGHLSAASLGAMSPSHGTPPHPLLRYPGLTSPFLSPMLHPSMFHPTARHPPHHVSSILQPSHMSHPIHQQPPHVIQPLGPTKMDAQSSTTSKEHAVVSSTVDHSDAKKTRIKREDPDSPGSSDGKPGEYPIDPSRIPIEGEPDFIETNCHWTDCGKQFETQDELVRHINQEHIQANKKSFVCRWTDCAREEKPFKAQYMLVVHMRRHTGEKPHRCTFEGCYKAYSRLENLKTHLRSHTGEKPYMCEFPGCTKAFSNASDRAKHQNRTHSNAKPYICKAPGCSKRYTDPSSLRKHVKTVHGPDFYANKKHKGNEHPSGGGAGSDSGGGHHGEDDSNSGHGDTKPGDFVGSPMTTFKTEDGSDHKEKVVDSPSDQPRQNQNGGGSIKSEQSPLSNHSDLHDLDHDPGGRPPVVPPQPHALGDSLGLDETEDEDDSLLLPDGSDGSPLTLRATRSMQPNRLRNRMNAKNSLSGLSGLPPIGNNRRSGSNQTDVGQRPTPSKHHKRLSDLMSVNSADTFQSYGAGRRDSNTSTLSSYMSSGRSESSPYPFQRDSSGRQSCESSQVSTHMSVANSPYEYDIMGNVRACSGRPPSEVSSITAHMERTKLGSQSLGSQSSLNHTTQLPPLPSPANRTSNDRAARYMAIRRENEGWGTQTSTPRCTPLPNELQNRDIRRASDPVRCAENPNFSATKQLQRFNSLNAVKPLPLPDNMKSLRPQNRAGSNQNFSSRSSIATTDYSIGEETDDESRAPGESQQLNTSLEEEGFKNAIMEESDDMLIPDDMKRFLNEQYQTVPKQPADSTVPDSSPRGHRGSVRSSRTSGNSVRLTPQPESEYSASNAPSSCCLQQNEQSQHSWPSAAAASESEPPMDAMKMEHPSCDAMKMEQSPCECRHPYDHQEFGTAQQHYPHGPHMGSNGMGGAIGQQGVRGTHAPPPSPMGPGPQRNSTCPAQTVGPHPPPLSPMMPHGPPPSPMGQHSNTPGSMGPHGPGGPMGTNGVGMGPINQQQQQQAQHQQGYNYGHMGNQVPMNYGPNGNVGIMQYGAPWMCMPQVPNMGMQQGYGQQYYNPMPPPSAPPPRSNHMTPGERASPMIQVPHVSQSVPPRQNRHYHHQNQQQQQQQQPHPPQQPYPAMQYHPYPPSQSPHHHYHHPHHQGHVPHPPSQSPRHPPYPCHPQNVDYPHYPPGPYGPHPPAASYQQPMPPSQPEANSESRPSCQLHTIQSGNSSLAGVQMSPPCNQVSSTTDAKECQTDLEPQLGASVASNLNSISTENFIDNLSSISMENLSNNMVMSPTQLVNRSASQTSSVMDGKASSQAGMFMDTSNMVVNDMSSVLTQLAEENRYLTPR